jgi:hypothetical protein
MAPFLLSQVIFSATINVSTLALVVLSVLDMIFAYSGWSLVIF